MRDQEFKVHETIAIENANIGFRNFLGREKQYNPAGRRNFCVFFDPENDRELVDKLISDGWNVKYTRPRDEMDISKPYLQVDVKFGDYPPSIWLVTSTSKTKLDETTVGILDSAEIASVDVIVRPYNYSVRGQTGVKAYLKTMYVRIVEDAFASKYADIPGGYDNDLPF